MAKSVATVGGLITLLGTLVGVYIPFMGLWYLTLPLGTVQNYAWFDILGSYHWVVLNHFIDQTTAHQIVQIIGYIIMAGGALTVLGGIAGSRGITVIGVIATIVGIVIFAITLQGVLDTESFFPGIFPFPYDSDYSIFFTFNADIPIYETLTQTLGGGFWACVGGIVLGLAGMSSMKK